MANEALLKIAVEAAVPLWIEQLADTDEDFRRERRQICSQVVAEKGDVIQFKGTKRGESANAFNHLAEGLALLAFAPGGVKFCGIRFDASLPFPHVRSEPDPVAETAVDSSVSRVWQSRSGIKPLSFD